MSRRGMPYEKWLNTFVENNRHDDNYEATEYLIRHIHGEKEVCSLFGCGKELSLMESLYGGRCQNHPLCKNISLHIVDKVIKFP